MLWVIIACACNLHRAYNFITDARTPDDAVRDLSSTDTLESFNFGLMSGLIKFVMYKAVLADKASATQIPAGAALFAANLSDDDAKADIFVFEDGEQRRS